MEQELRSLEDVRRANLIVAAQTGIISWSRFFELIQKPKEKSDE